MSDFHPPSPPRDLRPPPDPPLPLSPRLTSGDMKNKLERILEEHTLQTEDTKDRLLGATFVVVDKDGVVFQAASGRLDLPLASRKWELITPVWVASLTKLVTSIALLQLGEKGLLQSSTHVDVELPELGSQPVLEGFNSDGTPVTSQRNTSIKPGHLLTHTSGLPYDFISPIVKQWNRYHGRTATGNDWSREGFTNPLIVQPGKYFIYGAGVDWAGFLIEKVTQMPLGKYIQENIFDRVGQMRDATFYPYSVDDRHRSRYEERMPAVVKRAEDGTLEPWSAPRPPRVHDAESGGAGLFCSAMDYAALLRAVLTGGVLLQGLHETLFCPALNASQASTIYFSLKKLFGAAYKRICGDGGLRSYNHTMGAMMVMDDQPGRKRRGSIMWAGARDSHWWIDRETGIAAVLITSIERLGDPVVAKLYEALELELYRGLREAGPELPQRAGLLPVY